MTRTVKPPLKSSSSILGGLLIHLPDYGVVICKGCRFAIQPTAFSSHLQNHHILRSERRSILNQLDTLRLLQPDRVGVPTSDSPRVSGLPVLSGCRCAASKCKYACTSVKRMCQHWSDVHDEPNSKLIKYREAKLQTFFRGNKIRYFEVEGPKEPQCYEQKESQSAIDDASSLSPGDAAGESLRAIQVPPIDTQSLLYMHHFTSHSSRLLNRGNESSDYWSDTVVNSDAQKHPFLMYSILCTSAADKARKTIDSKERHKHLQASISYCAGAISGYRAAVARPTRDNSTALIVSSRLLGQQEVTHDLIKSQDTDHHFTIEDVIEHLVLLRGCTDLMIQLQPVLPPNSPFRLPRETRLGLMRIEENDNTDMPSDPGCVPADIWLILEILAPKMEAAGLLPECEAPLIKRVINALACAVSHVYDAKEDEFGWAGWNAVEGWLRSPLVSEELIPALRTARPAALVVFASWAILLLRRLERVYDWMTGLSEWFVRVAITAGQSTQLNHLVRDLYDIECTL
ncbi:hypothetical protein F4808DRAFT_91756 [Astrocystis sublimbata]|nr:hypothetical protein F4808DRAFT_91756 [Astrocystis sublimbata]